MRTPRRLVASAALLGGGLLLAGPVSAQETPEGTPTPCPYPFVNCAPETPEAPQTPPPAVPPVTPTTPPGTTPVGGSTGGGATAGETPAASDIGGSGGGTAVGGSGDATVVDNSAVPSTTASAASLPFTGGEITLMALAGATALGGGVVLVAAARKRATS